VRFAGERESFHIQRKISEEMRAKLEKYLGKKSEKLT